MLASMLCLLAAPELPPPADPATVIVLHAVGLNTAREQLQAGAGQRKALASLKQDADKALADGPWSVMDKALVPSSGDKHDYMSVGPYWWPNPDTPDGLPYVNRDGQVNPERLSNQTDSTSLSRMTSAATNLAMAWFFTGEARYAERAALVLRTWFLNPATAMHPNLNYGQAVPGRVEGRSTGIIDTNGWVTMLDAVGLLQGSSAWTAADQTGLQQWFSDYTDWLLTHPFGKGEQRAHNNHGTYYDLQVARFALFANRPEVARDILGKVGELRIAKHIEPDGRQPAELARTKAFGYSSMNLRGFLNLALLAETVGLDLWHFRTDDGRCIQAALDYLVPYADPAHTWPYQELEHGPRPKDLAEFLRRAHEVYGDQRYADLLATIPFEDYYANRWLLSWP